MIYFQKSSIYFASLSPPLLGNWQILPFSRFQVLSYSGCNSGGLLGEGKRIEEEHKIGRHCTINFILRQEDFFSSNQL